MEFKLACKTALEYFQEDYDDTGLSSIIDVGDRWVFSAGNKAREIFYGKNPVAIKKDGEEILPFYMPDEHNRKLIREGKDVEIPEEFKIR